MDDHPGGGGGELLPRPPVELRIDSPCPVCGAAPLEITSASLMLPYFGDAVQTTVRCPKCGFRHADVLLLEQREPVRYTLPINSPEDMLIRVIRSSSGTIRIPELGVLVEPGPASEAVVTNVEGVLRRVAEVVEMLTRTAETEEQRRRAEGLLEVLGGLMEGSGGATLILEDPLGNSAIVSEKATRTRLTEGEIRSLKVGAYAVDLS